jgi:MFS family permease
MAAFQPADSLRSRTFIGLLVAQFFAAFNDQALHAASMFFAINTQTFDESNAISLMPVLFYAPWAIFCTVAGWLADRYSKRNSLVFWKLAEVAITLVAFAGFALHNFGGYRIGPYLVLSTVFLMGMHSAFFVPAKYGVMPEILLPHLLSRGNGLLESLSFLAIILGTVFGGVLSTVFRTQEYLLGLVLVGLAVVGAAASLLIKKMPAANPRRPFPPYLYQPLWHNIRALLTSRPLAFAVVGIAFFTFIVTFMRSTVYMFGQVQSPRWTESKTSEVVGMVALGIGLGSPLVGYLSGKKVELGLVPIGAVGMIVVTVGAALALGNLGVLIGCIVLIGFFTGFYLVPMFTLLQHRAPKASKGDSIATSNFINVTGAIVAAVVFFGMDHAARLTGVAPVCPQEEVATGKLTADPQFLHGRPHKIEIDGRTVEGGERVEISLIRPESARGVLSRWFSADRLKAGDEVTETVFTRGGVTTHRFRPAETPEVPAYDKRGLPRLLYLSAAAMTLLTLLVLCRLLPDLFLRTRLWLRWNGPYLLELLAEAVFGRFVSRWLRWHGRFQLEVYGGNHLPGYGPAVVITNADTDEARLQVLAAADRTIRFVPPEGAGTEAALRRNEIIGVSLNGQAGTKHGESADALPNSMAPVVPVYYGVAEGSRGARRVSVVMGEPLPPGADLPAVREAIRRVVETFEEQKRAGTLGESSFVGGH